MKIDPVIVLVDFLKTFPDIPTDAVMGTLVGRNVGDTTIYLYHAGGFRMVRDRMDRADILYDVYGPDRVSASALAYAVREHLLETLPNARLDDAQVLDVREVHAPKWQPDQQSLEPAYVGEVSIFFLAD